MSAIELISLMTSTGVFAGGLGVLRWSLRVERRLMAIELSCPKVKEKTP